MHFEVDNKVMEAATVLWGEDFNINMVMEECAELIVALNHYRRRRCTGEEVAEEIADVYIILQQLSQIIGEKKIEEIGKRKMNRFTSRICDSLDDIPPSHKLYSWKESLEFKPFIR